MTRALILALLLQPVSTFAHETRTGWAYPTDCCSGTDCREVPDDDVMELSDGGWKYLPLGLVFPRATVRPSQDGHFHVCYSVMRKPLCVFIVQGM